MKTHGKKPEEITEKQEDGKKYIVYDRDFDNVEWYPARFIKPIKVEGKVVVKGHWLTSTIEPKIIHPTHYVDIAEDVI